MSETIHLIITPQQAKTLLTAVKLTKEILAVAPGTPVYPNLWDFQLEREFVNKEIVATQETLLKQMEEQMPKEYRS